MGRQFAGATRPPLRRRFERPCLRHALRQPHARARAYAKALSRSTARLAQRYIAVNPLPKINRMRFAHDPPPRTVNHILATKGIPADSDFTLDALDGVVEVDGAYFGGYVKPANRKADRIDRRTRLAMNGKRQSVVIVRERGGDMLTFVGKSEAEGVAAVVACVDPTAVIHADEASHWDALHGRYDAYRINHSEAYSANGACTNQAESFFSRLRRAEIGVHHHIAGPYLNAYAGEMAWREDNRRMPNGEQAMTVARSAMASRVSRQWKGYWQRAA